MNEEWNTLTINRDKSFYKRHDASKWTDWFENEIDYLTIERIWDTFETTLFYFSDNSTSPHIWPKEWANVHHIL